MAALRAVRDAWVDALAAELELPATDEAGRTTARTKGREALAAVLKPAPNALSITTRLSALHEAAWSKAEKASKSERKVALERAVSTVDGAVQGTAQKDAREAAEKLALVADDLFRVIAHPEHAAGATTGAGTASVNGDTQREADRTMLLEGGEQLHHFGSLGHDLGEIVTAYLKRFDDAHAKGTTPMPPSPRRTSPSASTSRIPPSARADGAAAAVVVANRAAAIPRRGPAKAASRPRRRRPSKRRPARSIASRRITRNSSERPTKPSRTALPPTTKKRPPKRARRRRSSSARRSSGSPPSAAAATRGPKRGRGPRSGEQVARNLEEGNVGDAEKRADSALQMLEEAKQKARRERMYGGNDAEKRIQEAATALEEAQRWSAAQKQEQSQKAAARARSSGELGKRADEEGKLADRMKNARKSGEGKALPDQANDALAQAEAAARRAQKALEKGDPSEAEAAQKEAQAALEAAQKALGNDGKSPKSPNDRDGDGTTAGHADIPGKEAHKGPEDFRRRVLEGLAGGRSDAADGSNGADAPPSIATELAQRSLNAAHEHIVDHSFAKAAEELASSRVGDGPVVRLERGRLALFEERCDEAAKLLIAADVAPIADAKDLLEIAQGCARVTAATPQRFDAASNISIRFQDPDDEALYPLLLETAIAAKAMLTKELGVDWPSTLRITVVRDHLSLSAMTGLPYESARTTGTVAVAKWGRVTLLSPRAPRHGYSFRDTLTHELTHLAVTRATADRAPLWLQEGLAKRQEIRWRAPGPYDARISPEAVAKRGETLGLTLPLDRLGPSIAMLPSADQAVVVFAEVTSFVKYLFASQPEGTVAKVLLALRNEPEPLAGHDADAGAASTGAGAASTGAGAASTGTGASGPAASGRVEAAMKAATGVGLVEWDKRWHAWLATQNAPLSATIGLQQKPDPSLEQVGEKSRLATLLLARGHAAAAAQELAAIAGKAEDDAALRTLEPAPSRRTEKPRRRERFWPIRPPSSTPTAPISRSAGALARPIASSLPSPPRPPKTRSASKPPADRSLPKATLPARSARRPSRGSSRSLTATDNFRNRIDLFEPSSVPSANRFVFAGPKGPDRVLGCEFASTSGPAETRRPQ
ncbi:hypothetical protein OUZ56_032593 [Daphnia magna]|uniref:Uncharacterized protein n=1 Tax=Daphnia magna TaxID=35525 RepID=A0ABR0B9C7_9CRUS|nr:hypothetical protein OUZ56_032593 [Daphnia magna]